MPTTRAGGAPPGRTTSPAPAPSRSANRGDSVTSPLVRASRPLRTACSPAVSGSVVSSSKAVARVTRSAVPKRTVERGGAASTRLPAGSRRATSTDAPLRVGSASSGTVQLPDRGVIRSYGVTVTTASAVPIARAARSCSSSSPVRIAVSR